VKIAVIADIHANFEALQAVLLDCSREQVAEIFSLGDNIGYGPEPENVVRTLIRQQVRSIRGNHELALVDSGYLGRMNFDARASLEINLSLMSQGDKEYAAGLPLVRIERGARFVHGCPPKSSTAYLFDPRPDLLKKIFASFPENIGFYGHTHSYGFFEYDGKESLEKEVGMGEYLLAPEKRYLLNPGSVGQPRDGINNKAKYIIWDLSAGTVRFKAVDYDVKATVVRIKALGLPEFNWERLMV
jgi:predicted phosphodiesterase